MNKFLYPDMEYQQKYYYEMVSQFKGIDLNIPKKQKTNIPKGMNKRCKCPQCGRHCASFFRSHNNDTFIMTCMEGCGLKKTLHQLVLEFGSSRIKKEWKDELKRLNIESGVYRDQFKKYGSPLPIKNAGRPKGSKTNKHRIKPITGMTDEVGMLGLRSALHWHRSSNDET